MTVSLPDLRKIYADSDDPWDFTHSDYEREKFKATRDALSRPSYQCALELGCGNGMLASSLAPHCAHYIGFDAIEKAIAAARRRVPDAEFFCDFYPCRLPDREFDLIVLSEILYFLSPNGIGQLARDIREIAPRCEIVCTTFLGDTEHTIQGNQSISLLQTALKSAFAFTCLVDNGAYRIDRGVGRRS